MNPALHPTCISTAGHRAQLLLLLTAALDVLALVSLNAPFLFKFELSPPTPDSDGDRWRMAMAAWNFLVSGLHSIDHRLLWNLLLLGKLALRLTLLVTLPLMLIGNRAGRASYLKPYKYTQVLTLLYALGLALYFLFAYTDVSCKPS